MKAGQLRHRITIQEPVKGTPNEFNETPITWDDVCEVWAAVLPKTAKEVQRNERITMDATHLVKIRYRDDIDNTMRVVFRGDVLNIDDVINTDERNIELLLVVMS